MEKGYFRQERRQVLKALLGGILLPISINASFLEGKISDLTPYSQVRYNQEQLPGVVWTKRDLEDIYPRMPASSETIRNLNSDLKKDHNPKIIALLQDEEPYDFLGSLDDVVELCRNMPAIRDFSREYLPTGLSLPSSASLDLFEEPKQLPQHKIFFPSFDFLKEKYEQTLKSGNEQEFLESYRKYIKEVNDLASYLGFNAVILPEKIKAHKNLYQCLSENENPRIQYLLLSKRELRNLKL